MALLLSRSVALVLQGSHRHQVPGIFWTVSGFALVLAMAAAMRASFRTFATKVMGDVLGPTYRNWLTVWTAAFGEPLTDDERIVFERLTHRTVAPASQVREVWAVVGRRAGKSFMTAVVVIFLTCCRQYKAAPGEQLMYAVIAADRRQARILKNYISGLMRRVPALAKLIADETKETLLLRSGILIAVMTCDFRTIRGYTIIGATGDEACFWESDDSASPDQEVLRALRPGMATQRDAMLFMISSPHAQRGEVYRTHRGHFGKNGDPVLVVQAPTREMNPTIPQEVIDQAYADDAVAAAAEFGAEFRSDLARCFSREPLLAATPAGLVELPASSSEVAYTDSSTGSGEDSWTLVGAKSEGDKAVLTFLREVRPPFSPDETVRTFAELLKARGITSVVGDRFAAGFVAERFQAYGISYSVCERTTSQNYLELLPLVNSQRVRLLDMPRLIAQLSALDRRTASGGREHVSHPPGAHDDLAAAAAGALVLVGAGAAEACGAVEEPEPALPAPRMWGRRPSANRVFTTTDREDQ